jgi:DNA mismatch repair protein MutL
MDVLTKSRIRVLPPEEARKIAAGEVVNRPASLVREFIDNALDAGSTLVELVIEGGGIRRTEVIDNGDGMAREDLELCWYTHATSKIRSLDDLNTADTLGFRGEALAAAAAVARLEILTSTDGREAWQLAVGPGNTGPWITQTRRAKGSNVRALGLFDTVPARKRFLKREGSEANLCRQAFIDKALAFYGISFRFIQDGKLKIFLPAVTSRKERFAQALLSGTEGLFLHEITAGGTGFSVAIVAGGPELYRNDRRQQYVFANGRRIQDYSLLQALEYGLQGWFPNGTHPIGGVYVDIDPVLADFNIHPAKQEVRFTDSGVIHHAITQALRDFSRRRNMIGTERSSGEEKNLWEGEFVREKAPDYRGWDSPAASPSTALALEALLENPQPFAPLPGRNRGEDFLAPEGHTPPFGENPADRAESPRLAGRAFNLFLLVEWKDRLFIIDQHAAHERLLFDRFMSEAIPIQELLVPIPFATESEEEDRFLSRCRAELAALGIVISGGEEGHWHIEALPINWHLGDAETVKEILKLKTAGENMAERWAATLSCHGAVKDGDYLDDTAALALAEAALKLPEARCPHGRPVWTELSREELFRAVRRR